ncbi:hypothetical protein D6851_08540 [Altericroceibacterium spongiae]|uniref:Short chain dehydrogenase-like proteobacteria domain-containing protein n=1 Tax=Altericroceibacterium spongiae TaxID=2320269 RepID=A0A420EJV0_9SPHN|nr:hypothetical protein [Altericroceibacterium spongiae]RKF20991.1 hypothetical protein D6851_08540 [Altericroceibacterium spongiae]
MAQAVLPVMDLPENPLDAAGLFYADYLPQARHMLAGPADALVIHFPESQNDQRGWQLAAIQSLARASTPKRVNAMAGPEGRSAQDMARWLEQAPGITGQLLRFAGNAQEIQAL